MSSAVEADVPFDLRMQLREKMLAWISRDVGLTDFLIPDELASGWTEQEREAWTTSVINKLMRLNAGPSGKHTRQRVFACETAGHLRRCCLQLRRRTATHRDVMKTGVALESLWDGVSEMLDDSTWATASLMFDTALISLRVAYLWIYLKTEASAAESDLETRKALFQETVKTFFTSNAPTDDAGDKHSANYKKLLEVWRQELDEYHKQDKFESLLGNLESIQSLDKTASCIEKFISTINMDKDWVLGMQKIDEEIKKGLWTRRARPRKGKGKRRNAEYEEPPSPPSEEFEPAASDSDFNIAEVEEEDVDDNDDDYNGSVQNDDEDLPHARMGSSGMELRASPKVMRGNSKKLAAKRRAALTAQKRIHMDTLYESQREVEREREAKARRPITSAEDIERQLQSPYVERRMPRNKETRLGGVRRRVLQGSRGGRNSGGNVAADMDGGDDGIDRMHSDEKQRQRLVEAALAGNDLGHNNDEVRRAPHRNRASEQ